MNGLARVGVIYRKEMVDALRDRRTLVAMVIAPLLLYPLLMIVVVQALQIQKARLERQRYRVAVPDAAHAAWLNELLARESQAASQPEASSSAPFPVAAASGQSPVTSRASEPAAGGADEPRGRPGFSARVVADQFDVRVADQDPTALLSDQQVQVVLRVEPAPRGEEREPPNRQVRIYFDSAEVQSEVAYDALARVVDHQADRIVTDRLKARGIERSMMSPLRIEARSLASPQKVGGALLGQIMPFLLVIMTITGAIYPAIDLTAGERERGTLETLVAAPVPMIEIVAGKFLVICTITIVITTLNLLSIGATVQFGGLADALARHGGGVSSVPVRVLPLVLGTMIPLAVLFSGVMLATCSFARTFKEAQNYMMPVMIGVMIPAMIVSYMPTLRLEGVLTVLPVANVVALIRELFLGKFNVTAIVLVLGSTTLYAGAAVLAAARLFGQEAVLFTDVAGLRAMVMRRFFRPRPRPSAAAALLLLAVIFPLQFYWQSSMIGPDAEPGQVYWVIVAQQALFFAAPAVLVAWYLRLNVLTTLSLRTPSPSAMLGAILLGLGILPISTQLSRLQLRVFPSLADEAGLEALQHLVTTGASLPVALLVFALTPAVCEELLFRGFLLAGLRDRVRTAPLCMVVGLLFGLFHVIAAKLLVTALLGMVLALLCRRSGSIYPAMAAHLLNNGIAVVAARNESLAAWLAMTDDSVSRSPVWLLPTAAVCAALGLGVILSGRRREARAA